MGLELPGGLTWVWGGVYTLGAATPTPSLLGGGMFYTGSHLG